MKMKNIFCCPECKKTLSVKRNSACCPVCGRKFNFSQGVWELLPKNLEENKINEDKLHLLPECDVFKYNKQVWRCLVDLAPHLQRFEKEILPKIKGKRRVLEIACGNGWASALVKLNYPKAEVYASDVSLNVLKLKTKKLCQLMGVKLDQFVVADAENLPFTDESFDFVFIIASLHHFPDIPKVLREVRRVLSKGGLFIGVDGTMPIWYQRLVFGRNQIVERSRKFGILEKLLTYRQWEEIIKSGGFPGDSLTLYTNPDYSQSVNNPDEAKINRFQFLKEIVFKVFVSRLPIPFVKFLCKIDLLPAGIVIEYTKK